MVTLTYGETNIPADHYSVQAGGTVQVAAAFERSVGLVGGMDTANGTASEGSVEEVQSLADAADLFGENSELYRQIDLAYQNGAVTVHAVGVPETSLDESVTGSAQGTLSNTPIFNPDLHPDHSLSVTDDTAATDMTVELVYTSPTQPSDTDTVRINPITGDWYADASSDYTFSYTYGDYSNAVVDITDPEPRIIGLCSESESVINSEMTEVNQDAVDYAFQHVHAGMNPFDDPSSPDISGYSNPFDEERLSIGGSPYGYIDDAETELTRTVGAVAGELASLPLGISSTRNSLGGLTGLRTDLSPNQAGDLADKGVMPLIDFPPTTIIKDMTTSSDPKFERVFTMQIVDEVITLLHEINSAYIGKQARDENIRNLRRSLKNMLLGLTTDEPPLLDTLEDERPYAVSVQRSDSNDNVFNERIGIDAAGVIDEIDVNVVVGDVVEITRS